MTPQQLRDVPLMEIFDIAETDTETIALAKSIAAERYIRLVGNGKGRWRFMEDKTIKRPRVKLPIGRPRSYTWSSVEALEVGQTADVELSEAKFAMQSIRNQATALRHRTGRVFSVTRSTKPNTATIKRVA